MMPVTAPRKPVQYSGLKCYISQHQPVKPSDGEPNKERHFQVASSRKTGTEAESLKSEQEEFQTDILMRQIPQAKVKATVITYSKSQSVCGDRNFNQKPYSETSKHDKLFRVPPQVILALVPLSPKTLLSNCFHLKKQKILFKTFTSHYTPEILFPFTVYFLVPYSIPKKSYYRTTITGLLSHEFKLRKLCVYKNYKTHIS